MWFRVDDKLPWHPKARRLRRGHPSKRRDASPFGLWVLAGAFSDDGFVALEVLEDWDDDAEAQAGRLVACGLWKPAERAGEPGYLFHDWASLNPADASQSGVFGNHMRWHVGANKPKSGCPLCESEGLVPTSGASRPDDRPDIAPIIGGESLPDPIRPDPPEPNRVENAPSDDDDPKPANSKAPKKPATKRPSMPLPEGWYPSAANIAFAAAEGVDLPWQIGQFRAHHLARDSRFVNWDQAFRTWLGNVDKFGGSPRKASPPGGGWMNR